MDVNNDKPKKKIKIKVNGATFNQDTGRQVRTGSAAVLYRDDKGVIQQQKNKDFAALDQQTHKEDFDAKRKAHEGDDSFHSVAAPRVGGVVEKTVQASGTGNAKLMIKSIKRARQSSASPQAKKASIRMLRRQN